MPPYRQATDKNQTGAAYQLARLSLEYGLVPDELKRDRKLLREIHSWIRAMNPYEETQPVNCNETLSELIAFNDEEFKETVTLTLFDEVQIELMSTEEKEYFRNILDGISDRIKEIIIRGKLIDNVQAQQGSPLPL
jgi:hypothetical protein